MVALVGAAAVAVMIECECNSETDARIATEKVSGWLADNHDVGSVRGEYKKRHGLR